MNDATQTKAKIAAAEGKGEDLRAEISRLETRRYDLLREMPMESGSYEAKKAKGFLDEIDARLEVARADLHRVKDQLAVLHEALPSEAEVAEADERVTALLDTASDYETEFRITWSRLLDALADAGEAAREVVGHRGRHRSAAIEAAHLVSEWGLTRDDAPRRSRTGPDRLAAPRAEEDLASALIELVRSAVQGDVELDRAVVGAVEDAQRALRGQVAA